MSQAFQHSIHPAHEAAGVPLKPPPVRDRQLAAEGQIEARLHQLGDEIHELTAAPYPGLLQDRSSVREALEELTAKHTTLVWTSRVAKCTDGLVRERLWRDINRALESLERIAGSLVAR
jgi:hypothetical protein